MFGWRCENAKARGYARLLRRLAARAVGSFVVLLIYMFAPLDNFPAAADGLSAGDHPWHQGAPIGPCMTELAKVFAATPGATSARCFRR